MQTTVHHLDQPAGAQGLRHIQIAAQRVEGDARSSSRHCNTVRVAVEERSTHFQSSVSAGSSDFRRSESSEAKIESTCTRNSVVRLGMTAMWRSIVGRNPASDTTHGIFAGLEMIGGEAALLVGEQL